VLGVFNVFWCWLLGVRDTMVLSVFGWEVFWEPLCFYKFWWDLGLGSRNMNISIVTSGFDMFSCICGICVNEIQTIEH
jgi:hypothetical protein